MFLPEGQEWGEAYKSFTGLLIIYSFLLCARGASGRLIAAGCLLCRVFL